METVHFQGTPCHTYGSLPIVGETAPCFTLVDSDMKEVRSDDLKGRTVVLNAFPSLDTSVCAASVRRFNQAAAELPGVTVICVSMDLPFAAKRFCTAEGIDNVIVASAFRSPLFRQKYGLELVDGPLAGLLARAVIIFNADMKIIYRQLVGELTSEPDYRSALNALKRHEATAVEP